MFVGMMDSDFNLIERNYDRKYLQIDNIYCPVGNRKTLPSYMPLKEDIENNFCNWNCRIRKISFDLKTI